jgi:hypothetical protein
MAYHFKLPSYAQIVSERVTIASNENSIFHTRFLSSAWNLMKSCTVGKPKTITSVTRDERGNTEWITRKRNKRELDSIRRKHSNLNALGLNMLDALLVLLPLTLIHDIVAYCAFNLMFPEPEKNLRSNFSITKAVELACDQLLGDTHHEYLQHRVKQMFFDVTGEIMSQSRLLPSFGIPCVAIRRRNRGGPAIPAVLPVATFPYVKQTHLIQKVSVIGETRLANNREYAIDESLRRHREHVAWILVISWQHTQVHKRGYGSLIKMSMANKRLGHLIDAVLGPHKMARRQIRLNDPMAADGRIGRVALIANLAERRSLRMPVWSMLLLAPRSPFHTTQDRTDDERDTDAALLQLIEEARVAFFRQRHHVGYNTLAGRQTLESGYVIEI